MFTADDDNDNDDEHLSELKNPLLLAAEITGCHIKNCKWVNYTV